MAPHAGVFILSAIVCAAAAAAGAAFVLVNGRDRSRHEWLIVASLVAAPLGPGLTALTMSMNKPMWIVVASAITGFFIACVPLTAALLMLPGRPHHGGSWRRDLLDGLLAGEGIYSWCWTLLLMNGFGLLSFGHWRGTVGTAIALLCLVSGLGFVAVARAHRPIGRIFTVAASLVLIALAGVLAVLALIQGWTGQGVALALIPIPVACLLLAGTVLFPKPAERADQNWPLAPFGAAPAFIAVASICTCAVIQTVRIHVLDLGVAVIGIPLAVLLGLRIALALSEARRSAQRLRDREAQYWAMANIDPLTGLSNRRRLWQALEDRVEPSTLLIFDLDGFKDINDLNGHDFGDAVLVEAGRRLQATIQPEDLAVRLGGDEFAALMATEPCETKALADRLLGALCRPYNVVGGTVHLSASIGYAASTTAEDTKGMMRNADLALRFAKQRGKRRVEAFDIFYDRSLQRRLAIEHDMRGSGKRNELTLAYQPVVALPSGRVVGVEALLRWQHPILGPLSPAEFVPIAEEAGLIGELGAWVTNQACHQLSLWRASGHHLWMAVNVSPRELRAPLYLTHINGALQRYGIPPGELVLELTESAAAQDSEHLASTLKAVRATGIRIALDDFGAGYSSLGQLRRLEVDILKIDRELVIEPPRAPALSGAPLVDVIVALGQRLGLDVIAEGVENASQRELVELAGCSLCQGFYFAEPMSAESISCLLARETQAPVPG